MHQYARRGRPEDFIIRQYGHDYPFCEDEDANITGYGHLERRWFAEEVARFDREIYGDADPDHRADWSDQIVHTWVRFHDDDEHMSQCTANVPGAFPATVLWGAR